MCNHSNFMTEVEINRLGDHSPVRFCADIRIRCEDCGLPFRFIGLPAGVDLNGAATSVDATEGRFAIAPKGEVISVIEGGVSGFSVRRQQ